MFYTHHQPFSVGINTSRFDNVYARQQAPLWCWAACLEMVMKHNGVNVPQTEFAELTCGVDWQGLPYNCAASFDVITQHLNSVWTDSVSEYRLDAPLQYGSPDLFRLHEELRSNNPVIVAVRNRNSTIGHAVLITAIEGYYYGDSIYVTKFIIRDPAPTLESYFTRGRFEKNNARNFVNSISAHWFVNVSEYETHESSWLDFSSW